LPRPARRVVPRAPGGRFRRAPGRRTPSRFARRARVLLGCRRGRRPVRREPTPRRRVPPRPTDAARGRRRRGRPRNAPVASRSRSWHGGRVRPRDAGRTSWPVSRILSPGALRRHRWATIHLGPPSPTGSSGLPAGIGRATLKRLRSSRGREPFGLAPGGVYRATPVTRGAGGLLHHRFTLTPRGVREAVCFLWHFPAGHPGLPLATTLPCGVRTFLDDGGPVAAAARPARPLRPAYRGADQDQRCAASTTSREPSTTRTRNGSRARTPTPNVVLPSKLLA